MRELDYRKFMESSALVSKQSITRCSPAHGGGCTRGLSLSLAVLIKWITKRGRERERSGPRALRVSIKLLRLPISSDSLSRARFLLLFAFFTPVDCLLMNMAEFRRGFFSVNAGLVICIITVVVFYACRHRTWLLFYLFFFIALWVRSLNITEGLLTMIEVTGVNCLPK